MLQVNSRSIAPSPACGGGSGVGVPAKNTAPSGDNSPTRRALPSASTSPASGRGAPVYAVRRLAP
jgi:hypothetical protein